MDLGRGKLRHPSAELLERFGTSLSFRADLSVLENMVARDGIEPPALQEFYPRRAR
jgi:hypothetical protein